MGYHNETCGCPECGNYGQPYNPHAIHNQSCGCAACGNYPAAVAKTEDRAAPAKADTEVVGVRAEPPEEQIVHYVLPRPLQIHVGGTRTACGRTADGLRWSPLRFDATCRQCRAAQLAPSTLRRLGNE